MNDKVVAVAGIVLGAVLGWAVRSIVVRRNAGKALSRYMLPREVVVIEGTVVRDKV